MERCARARARARVCVCVCVCACVACVCVSSDKRKDPRFIRAGAFHTTLGRTLIMISCTSSSDLREYSLTEAAFVRLHLSSVFG